MVLFKLYTFNTISINESNVKVFLFLCEVLMFPQVWDVIPDLAHLNTLLDGDIIEEEMVRRKKEREQQKQGNTRQCDNIKETKGT